MDAEADDDKYELIRRHAYLMWLDEGQPEGRADEHWRAACEAIEAEASLFQAGAQESDATPETVRDPR